jgi:hypothetical protein
MRVASKSELAKTKEHRSEDREHEQETDELQIRGQ